MENNSKQNTPQNIAQPLTSLENPKKSFPIKWLSLGAGLVLIIIILSGTYFLNKNSTSKTQITTPTPTPDPTTNWKTYTGTDYSFKYPENLIYYKRDNTNNTAATIFFGRKPTDKERADYKDAYTVNPPETLLWDSFGIDQYIDNKTSVDLLSYTNKPTLYKTGDITIDGIKGKEFFWGCQDACVDIVFKKDNIITKFHISNFQDANLQTLHKIISTFKFTDQANQETNPTPTNDSMTNWKSYSDANYPFQIKYPNTWNLRITYGKSVNNLNNHRIAGIDISDNLTYGSTIVVNVMSYDNEGFQEWMKLYSGHGNELPYKENSTYNGNLAYRFTYPIDQKPDGVEIYYRYKDKVIFIAWHTPTTDQQPLVDKILNTLKFTP